MAHSPTMNAVLNILSLSVPLGQYSKRNLTTPLLLFYPKLFQDEFRYLLVTIEYEPFAHRGRPHSISYNAVKELFGSFSNLKFVAQLPAAPPLKPNWKENVFSMISGTYGIYFALVSSFFTVI